jgi:hypothetical protein
MKSILKIAPNTPLDQDLEENRLTPKRAISIPASEVIPPCRWPTEAPDFRGTSSFLIQ